MAHHRVRARELAGASEEIALGELDAERAHDGRVLLRLDLLGDHACADGKAEVRHAGDEGAVPLAADGVLHIGAIHLHPVHGETADLAGGRL